MSLRDRLQNLVRWDGQDRVSGALEGEFFPVLKPKPWAVDAMQAGVIVRPLVDRDTWPDDSPMVAYAIDAGEVVAFLNRDQIPALVDGAEIHEIALTHLRSELTRRARFEHLDGGMLGFHGSYYAAEAILCPEILEEAQRLLGSDFIGVAAPTRGRLIFASGEAGPEQLARLAIVAAGLFHEAAEAPISPHVFAARSGELIGFAEGLDEIQTSVANEVASQRRADSEKIRWSEVRRGTGDGEAKVFVVRASETSGADALSQVDGFVKCWTHEHQGDASLSRHVRVELRLDAAERERESELREQAADLEGFLNRMMATTECGPREGQTFEITVTIGWLEEETTMQDDPSAKREFADREWQLLADGPALIFMLVAAADGKVDKKEAKAFTDVLIKAASVDHPVIHPMFAAGLQDPLGRIHRLAEAGDATDRLQRIAALLDEKLEDDEANTVKMALMAVGKEVAEASGGFFGFGRKISDDEAKALAVVMACLGFSLE